MAIESSGDQIDLSHLNTIFELYPSYHLGQVVVSAQSFPFFSAHCPSLNIMCNISSQSFYRQIAAFGYFGSYILINSSKAFSASAFVSACQMLCNKPLTLLLGEFGKAVGDVHRFVHPASLLASLGTVSLPQGQSILSRFHPSCRSKGPSNIAWQCCLQRLRLAHIGMEQGQTRKPLALRSWSELW